MKSIKPGRGPSMMSGAASICAGLFGVIWTVLAASVGGGLFALFGLVFIAFAVISAVYHFKNATSKHRYSAFDITDHMEEPDSLNQRFGTPQEEPSSVPEASGRFCPYCGIKVQTDFAYCNQCGKKLP